MATFKFLPTPTQSSMPTLPRGQGLRIPVREDLESAGRDSHDTGVNSVLDPIHSKRRRLSIQYVISYYSIHVRGRHNRYTSSYAMSVTVSRYARPKLAHAPA